MTYEGPLKIRTKGIFLPNATVACFRNCFIGQKTVFLTVSSRTAY